VGCERGAEAAGCADEEDVGHFSSFLYDLCRENGGLLSMREMITRWDDA
jgi:hypothetical protein